MLKCINCGNDGQVGITEINKIVCYHCFHDVGGFGCQWDLIEDKEKEHDNKEDTSSESGEV